MNELFMDVLNDIPSVEIQQIRHHDVDAEFAEIKYVIRKWDTGKKRYFIFQFGFHNVDPNGGYGFKTRERLFEVYSQFILQKYRKENYTRFKSRQLAKQIET